jgi:hypothetical protein
MRVLQVALLVSRGCSVTDVDSTGQCVMDIGAASAAAAAAAGIADV